MYVPSSCFERLLTTNLNRPRRRSVVEAETRAILDDNAPPLASFYDELIAEELHLKHLENIPPVNTQGQHNPNLVNGQLVPVPTHRPVLDQPKAVRVSNYSENRWQEVLRALAPFGTILERFEELRRIPYYEPIPTKVLAESDDDVAKQARFICTGDGWTKITFARRESAEEVIALSGSIQIGGRDLVIEPWNPSLHGRPAGIAYPARPAASAPLAPVPQEPTMFASSSDLFAGNGFTRRRAEQQQQQAMFTESFAISVPMTSAPVRVPRIPLSTPGGTELSTQMRGAKVIQLKQVEFKKQPGLVTQLMSWIWGEVGPAGGHLEDSGWVAWFVNLLFGRL